MRFIIFLLLLLVGCSQAPTKWNKRHDVSIHQKHGVGADPVDSMGLK